MKQHEKEKQGPKKSHKLNKKRKRIVAVIVVLVLLFILIGFAWYYFNAKRQAASDQREVMAPYYLYLLDSTGSDYFHLTVGNLHPGETKQVIVGVSNKDPKGDATNYTVGKNSKFAYELEMAYTENLPLTYTVYEMQKTEATSGTGVVAVEQKDGSVAHFQKKEVSGSYPALQAETTETTTKNREEMYGSLAEQVDVTNLGQYDVYEKDANNQILQLVTTLSGTTVNFDLDYYMVEINWKDGIRFSDYTKETDLVYVVVKALQPKPEQ